MEPRLRLARASWGQGYAQEIIRAAVAAARRVRFDVPVTAYLLEHNVRSKAAAERAGLHLVWQGRTRGTPIRRPCACSTPTGR